VTVLLDRGFQAQDAGNIRAKEKNLQFIDPLGRTLFDEKEFQDARTQ
jgi:hypothetical protein